MLERLAKTLIIQFHFYFSQLENYYSKHPGESVTVCEVTSLICRVLFFTFYIFTEVLRS